MGTAESFAEALVARVEGPVPARSQGFDDR